jgi:hypothetical protein
MSSSSSKSAPSAPKHATTRTSSASSVPNMAQEGRLLNGKSATHLAWPHRLRRQQKRGPSAREQLAQVVERPTRKRGLQRRMQAPPSPQGPASGNGTRPLQLDGPRSSPGGGGGTCVMNARGFTQSSHVQAFGNDRGKCEGTPCAVVKLMVRDPSSETYCGRMRKGERPQDFPSISNRVPFYLYPGLQLWLGHQHVHSQALAVEGVQLIVQQSTRDGHTVHNLCRHTERASMKTSRSLRRCMVTTHQINKATDPRWGKKMTARCA